MLFFHSANLCFSRKLSYLSTASFSFFFSMITYRYFAAITFITLIKPMLTLLLPRVSLYSFTPGQRLKESVKGDDQK